LELANQCVRKWWGVPNQVKGAIGAGMKQLHINDALLAHSAPSLDTKSAMARVAAIQTAEALDVAEPLERALNGRSAVMEAIARRRTEIRVAVGR
jgi:hypothetical protein